MKPLRLRVVRVALDLSLLVGFIAAFLTREGPDYDLHSWIGVALIPAVGVHLAGNWRWVENTSRRRNAHPEWNLAVFNLAFSVITSYCILSGFPIWLGWSEHAVWTVSHQLTGLLSVVLALSHLWWNRRRLVNLVARSRVRQPA